MALLNDGQIVEYGTLKELCLLYNSKKKYRVLLEKGEELLLDQNDENINRIATWMKKMNQVEALHSCEPTLETVF